MQRVECEGGFHPFSDPEWLSRRESPADLAQRSNTNGRRSIAGSKRASENQFAASRRHFDRYAYLKHIEQDVELDGVLASYAMIHDAGIRNTMEHENSSHKDDRLGQITLVRQSHMLAPDARSKEVV